MTTLRLFVVDARSSPVREASVRLLVGERQHPIRREETSWIAEELSGVVATVQVSASGFLPVEHRIRLHDSIEQAVIGLPRGERDMPYTFGNSRFIIEPQVSRYLLRVDDPQSRRRLLKLATSEDQWPELRSVAEARRGQEWPALALLSGSIESAPQLTRRLGAEGVSATALLPISHGQDALLGLGKEGVVRFRDDLTGEITQRIAARHDCRLVRRLPYAGNAYLAEWGARHELPSYELLAAFTRMAAEPEVVYAQPNLIFEATLDQHIPDDPLWSRVPYLKTIGAHKAWSRLAEVHADLRGGSPDICIAIADPQGVDPTHGEFAAKLTDGKPKLAGSWDFASDPVSPQSVGALKGDHGTQCAGTAVAAFDDDLGLPGVAPNCRLLGLQLPDTIDEVRLADAFFCIAGFPAQAGNPQGFPTAPGPQAADVISTSWGKNGMNFEVLRECFEFLTTFGRGGRGCVLCFSVGNNGFVDFTDMSPPTFYRAWPAYERTIAVGASIGPRPTDPVPDSSHAAPDGNDTNIPVALNTRALYSPYGNKHLRKPDLVAPSSTAIPKSPQETHIDPVLSAVRSGHGDVDGSDVQAPAMDYAKRFGGTSHSTPAVAGAIALLLSARPELSWVQVRETLRQTSRRIDKAQSDVRGKWLDLDNDGRVDFSPWYGAGCLDADKAMQRVLSGSTKWGDTYVRDRLTDDGSLVNAGDPLPDSPDIWVRQNSNEAPPTLSWQDTPPHQAPAPGRENAVHCRLRNRGQAAAPVTYLRALVAVGSPLDIRYPTDYQPPLSDTETRGARLIGSSAITNLAPGQNEIVTFTWTPDDTRVTVAGAPGIQARRSLCLLIEASPHDGPRMMAGGRTCNNIAVLHVHDLDSGNANPAEFIQVDVGSADGVTHLVIDATGLPGSSDVFVCITSGATMTAFSQTAAAAPLPAGAIVAPASLHQLDCVKITLAAQIVELPLSLPAGHSVGALVSVASGAHGHLRITQRCTGGILSVGLRVSLRPSA